ncbi:MAG TPA: diguanylate cyclase [Gallionella sp.]|nr:diguanylate cyclase [Gallionella sp.]
MFSRPLHPALAACLAAAIVFAGVLSIEKLERTRATQDQRLHAMERVSVLRSKLESSISRAVASTSSMAALNYIHPDLTREQFVEMAQGIVTTNPAIHHIALIRGHAVSELYPPAAHPPSIAADIQDEALLRAPFKRMLNSRTTIISTPTPGNAAFSVFIPVLHHNSQAVSGAISAAILLDRLLEDAGLADIEQTLQISLRTRDTPGQSGTCFYGSAGLFSDSPVLQSVHVPGGEWEIAAHPRGGWSTGSPTLVTIRILGGILCLLAAALAFLLVRHLQRRTDSELRLSISEAQLKQRSAELIHQNAVLEMLTHNADLPDILEMLALLVEVHHPDMLCSILLLDPDGLHLRHGAAPNLPDFYNQAIDGLPIGQGIGCCGTAAHTGKRVIVEDIQTHPYWENYRALAEQARLRSCWSQPIKDSAERVLGTFAIYHHFPATPVPAEIMLIERYAALAALAIERSHNAEAMRLHDTALNSAANAIVITDLEGCIVWANHAFSLLTGYEFEEAIGHELTRLIDSGKQDAAFYTHMWETLLSGEIWHGESINRRKDGNLFYDETTITPVRNHHGELTHFVAIKQDISRRKQDEEHLKNLAFYDPLTQLPNRRLLLDRLNQSIASCKRTAHHSALIFIDLDNFKPLNDRYGHDVGDLLLAEAAQRIVKCVREADTVSRFGGDEFVVLLKDLDADPATSTGQATSIAEKIRAALSTPYRLKLLQPMQGQDEIVHRCTSSIGIALFSDQKVCAEEVLKQADIAMYQSKEAGRDTIRLYVADDR